MVCAQIVDLGTEGCAERLCIVGVFVDLKENLITRPGPPQSCGVMFEHDLRGLGFPGVQHLAPKQSKGTVTFAPALR